MIVELKKKILKDWLVEECQFRNTVCLSVVFTLDMHLPHVEDSQTAGLAFPIRGPGAAENVHFSRASAGGCWSRHHALGSKNHACVRSQFRGKMA